jgi:hypothetical protein
MPTPLRACVLRVSGGLARLLLVRAPAAPATAGCCVGFAGRPYTDAVRPLYAQLAACCIRGRQLAGRLWTDEAPPAGDARRQSDDWRARSGSTQAPRAANPRHVSPRSTQQLRGRAGRECLRQSDCSCPPSATQQRHFREIANSARSPLLRAANAGRERACRGLRASRRHERRGGVAADHAGAAASRRANPGLSLTRGRA